MKFIQTFVLALVSVFLAAACDSGREVAEVQANVVRTEAWPDEVQRQFAEIPVLDRGRVKPLSTFVGFRLLVTNGKRSFKLVSDTGLPTAPEKLTPVTWALDVMLFPEQARHYEVFLVDDKAVLEQMGLRFEGRKRRDRYSYNQLAAGREALERAAEVAKAKDPKMRDLVDSQILRLRSNLIEYELLEMTFPALHTTLGTNASERLKELFPSGADGGKVSIGQVAKNWGTIRQWAADAQDEAARLAFEREITVLDAGLQPALRRADFALALVPPADPENEVWRTAGGLMLDTIQPGASAPSEGEVAILDALAGVWSAQGDVSAAAAQIAIAHGELKAAAEARGEFAKIPVELSYYKRNYFTNALVLFLLAFVVLAVWFMIPSVGWLPKVSRWTTILATLLVVAGVTTRCLLLERPPVATLYETVLFITSIAVIVCLVGERMVKERLLLAMGSVLGAGGMFLAYRYELVEAKSQGDTMGGLLAVLNTNFWLATHVTTVTMGYSAGLLAAALAHVWLAMRVWAGFRAKAGGSDLSGADKERFRRFGRVLYGVLCFGLLFSVVGTILGGVWANDSWGRFWGWDPKENGALMIVLYELTILHARMGGYIKDFGVAVLSVLGGGIVAFSWWHVNQLGVGLHSYGFTDGVKDNLFLYYKIVALFLLFSFVGWALFVRPGRKVTAA